MKVATGSSTRPTAAEATRDAAGAAVRGLEGRPVDLAMLFSSQHHAEDAWDVLQAIHDVARPAAVIGCVAEAVVAGSREIEREPAVSVWLASLPGPVETFHQVFVRTESGGAFAGWRFQAGDQPSGHGPVHLMICDPVTFPVDALLQHLNQALPGTLIVGGMAGGAQRPGATVLFRDRSIHHEGAVGVRLPGSVRIRALVSQGCRPIGEPYVVTRAEDNFLLELGGRPPLERLRELVATLGAPDRELVSNGLHLGQVIDEYKAEHEVGDFLIRGVLGANPDNGAIAVGDRIEVGQTVRFHVRDAAAADEELRSILEREVTQLPGRPAGALLFTCNGRGSNLFGAPDHDARLVTSMLGGVPVAGFFCAGELGPVGGRNFLHGFTASVAILVEDERDVSPG
jgi:small ligand-binding sensory domain FIST